MFWIQTIIAFVTISLVLILGSTLERYFANMPSPRPGLVLPFLATLVAVALAVPNFVQSFSYPFSPLAFGASVALFVFYMIPAATFMLLYTETRRELSERAKRRTAAGREVRRQVTRERMDPKLSERNTSDMRSSDKRRMRRPEEGHAPRAGERFAEKSEKRPPSRPNKRPTDRPEGRNRR